MEVGVYTMSMRIQLAMEFEASWDFGHPQFPNPIFFKADLYYFRSAYFDKFSCVITFMVLYAITSAKKCEVTQGKLFSWNLS